MSNPRTTLEIKDLSSALGEAEGRSEPAASHANLRFETPESAAIPGIELCAVLCDKLESFANAGY